MSGKPLVFMMGKSPTFLPTDRRYARNHMWAAEIPRGYRFGLTAYAVKLLGDVQHFGWSVEAGSLVRQSQPIGHVEASKASSDLYAPICGTLVRLSSAVPATPTLINTNLYDEGWLLEMEGDGESLLSPQDYLALVEAAWPLAQRLLKGQAGRQSESQA